MGRIMDERHSVPELPHKKRVVLKAEKKRHVANLTGESEKTSKEWRLYISIKKNDLFIGVGGLNWIVKTTIEVDGFRYYILAVPGWEGGEIEGQDIVEFHAIEIGPCYVAQSKRQFYYPDETEIKVGWEGQVNWAVGYTTDWQDIVISYPKEGESWETNIVDVLSLAIWDGCAEVRCPLLYKEQIQKEGWEYIANINQAIFRFKDTWEIWWFSNDMSIEVHGFKRLHYRGSCPTINHLRDIMKLLNIK